MKDNDFVQNFISELSNYLEGSKERPIIEDILSKNKLTDGNARSIRWNLEDVILKYAEKNFENSAMYFAKDNKKTYWENNKEKYDNSAWTVLKVENNKIEEINVGKNNIPKDVQVNDVFTIENGNYLVDKNATEELKQEIENMAQKIINKQNETLEKNRKDGHLYLVCEEVGNSRFLKDITEKSNKEFQEVNIPKDVLEKATEGKILKFTNGKYEYYSEKNN